jgi:hypothetical protein
MIALVGSAPKYRPSSESADCQFQEDLAFGDDTTALPGRQRSTSAVALARLAQRDVVDGNSEPVPANCLPSQCKHAL